MKVWMVDNDVTGDRFVYGSKEAALNDLEDGDPEGDTPFKGAWIEVTFRMQDPDFAHLRNHGSLVGSLWGIEVRSPDLSGNIYGDLDQLVRSVSDYEEGVRNSSYTGDDA